jgi:hypothetical protein
METWDIGVPKLLMLAIFDFFGYPWERAALPDNAG